MSIYDLDVPGLSGEPLDLHQFNGRHPLCRQLVVQPDEEGETGDIQWNFEKFFVAPTGEIVRRFRPVTDPEADQVVRANPAVLPK